MHKLWAEYFSCGTVDSISNVRAHVSSKIHEHSNPTAVVEIARGRLSMWFGDRLSFGRGELLNCSSYIKDKSFQ